MTLLKWDDKRPEAPETKGLKWNDPVIKGHQKAVREWSKLWRASIKHGRHRHPVVEIKKRLGSSAVIIVDEDGNMKISTNGKVIMTPEESRELVQAIEEAVIALAQWRAKNEGQ